MPEALIMITTFTGANTFLLKQALQEKRTAFIQKHGAFELEELDGAEASLDNVRTKLQSLPFLSDKKLLILRSPSAINGFAEAFDSMREHASDQTDVVIVETELDKRTGYARALKAKTDYQSFDELKPDQLSSWLTQEAKSQGATLSRADANMLVQRAGTNQYLLFNELSKLTTASNTISRDLIEKLVEPIPQQTIFELLDAVFAGQANRAMELYDSQRAQQVEPQMILSMLARQLHIILLIKLAPANTSNNAIASEAKLHPFVVQKASQSARSRSVANIKSSLHELRQIDRLHKTQSVSLDESLRYFIVTLAKTD